MRINFIFIESSVSLVIYTEIDGLCRFLSGLSAIGTGSGSSSAKHVSSIHICVAYFTTVLHRTAADFKLFNLGEGIRAIKGLI